MHNIEMSWCYAALTLTTILTLLTNVRQWLQTVYRTPPDMQSMPSGSFAPLWSHLQHRLKEGKQKQIPACLPTEVSSLERSNFTSKTCNLRKQQELQETSSGYYYCNAPYQHFTCCWEIHLWACEHSRSIQSCSGSNALLSVTAIWPC